MTLNGMIAPIFLVISPNSIDYETDYVTVVKDRLRPIRFGAEYPLQVISWPELTHAAITRSLCDS